MPSATLYYTYNDNAIDNNHGYNDYNDVNDVKDTHYNDNDDVATTADVGTTLHL